MLFGFGKIVNETHFVIYLSNPKPPHPVLNIKVTNKNEHGNIVDLSFADSQFELARLLMKALGAESGDVLVLKVQCSNSTVVSHVTLIPQPGNLGKH